MPRTARSAKPRADKIDQIEREIELEGPLDNEQRQRLLEIADRCPVHRTLHSEIIVKIDLERVTVRASRVPWELLKGYYVLRDSHYVIPKS